MAADLTRARAPCDRRAWGPRAATLLAILLLSAPSAAQAHVKVVPGVTAPALKAAFLYNFANFAEWPVDALAPGQRLSLCVIGDGAVADALVQAVQGRGVDNHELRAEALATDGPILGCHLLYISGLDPKASAQLLDALNGKSVFTVGDGDRFAEAGGVAQLILENGRVRFLVNMAAARRARLKISFKVLSLATIIKDPTDAQR
jgi:hypothetical protein